MKYNVASRRMTVQRLLIPHDVGGISLLAVKTTIRKARISITQNVRMFRAPNVEDGRRERTESEY